MLLPRESSFMVLLPKQSKNENGNKKFNFITITKVYEYKNYNIYMK